jgi:ABC-type Fe3+ transport system permease subunit
MLTKKVIATLALTLGCCAVASALPAQTDSYQAPGSAPQSRPASSPSTGEKILDAVVVRPVTFAASLVSGAVFIASLPLMPLDSGTDLTTSRKALVDSPFGDTFTRPLGDFGGPGRPNQAP